MSIISTLADKTRARHIACRTDKLPFVLCREGSPQDRLRQSVLSREGLYTVHASFSFLQEQVFRVSLWWLQKKWIVLGDQDARQIRTSRTQMVLYSLPRHPRHLNPDLTAVSLKQYHLKVTGRVHLDIEWHETDAPLTVTSSGGQYPKGRQHTAGDGTALPAAGALLLAPWRRFSAVRHSRSIICTLRCYVSRLDAA